MSEPQSSRSIRSWRTRRICSTKVDSCSRTACFIASIFAVARPEGSAFHWLGFFAVLLGSTLTDLLLVFFGTLTFLVATLHLDLGNPFTDLDSRESILHCRTQFLLIQVSRNRSEVAAAFVKTTRLQFDNVINIIIIRRLTVAFFLVIRSLVGLSRLLSRTGCATFFVVPFCNCAVRRGNLHPRDPALASGPISATNEFRRQAQGISER